MHLASLKDMLLMLVRAAAMIERMRIVDFGLPAAECHAARFGLQPGHACGHRGELFHL
jgi:hypothetical protein